MHIRGKEAYKAYYKGNLTAVIAEKAVLKRKSKNCKVGKLTVLKQN